MLQRDLEPGNIMPTPSGVKLLDFGLHAGDAPREAGALSVALHWQALLK